MTVTTNERGQQNLFAKEPQMYVTQTETDYAVRAEQLNGRVAMLGFVAAVISYATTGSVFFFDGNLKFFGAKFSSGIESDFSTSKNHDVFNCCFFLS